MSMIRVNSLNEIEPGLDELKKQIAQHNQPLNPAHIMQSVTPPLNQLGRQ